MNKRIQYHALSACALAATLLLAACGGGSSTDTTPPTVAITSAAGTGSNVLFTFAFSEALATGTFTVDDIVVTGGTAGAFTMVDSSHATLVVTPTTGTLSASVAANKFDDVAHNFNTAAATNTYTPASTQPSTSAPTPTALASNVTSIYSDAYTATAGVSFAQWGSPTVDGELSIGTDKVKSLTAFTYEGIDFSNNKIDISGKDTLHIDVWSPNVTELDLYVISINGTTVKDTFKFAITPTPSAWKSIDIPLTAFSGIDLTSVAQIKLTNGPTNVSGGIVYFDNLYFYKAATTPVACGTTEPTCAPSTVVPAGATTIYSETTAAAGFDAFPNWGQSTQFSEVALANNKSLKYSNLNYQGLAFTQVDVTAKGKLHLDVWSAVAGSLNVGIITSGVLTGGAALETQVPQALVVGWNSLDIPLTSFTAPNKAKIDQIVLVGSGTIFVDNIFFWDAAAAGGSGGGSTTPAVLGSGGAQAMTIYPASGAPACGAPAQPLCLFTAGDYIFAGDYKGGVEAGTGRFATFVGAQTVSPAALPSALAGGDIGHYNDPAMDTSAQKLAAEGWVTGTSSDAAGSPNFFYQFVLTKPASTFASSYMGVYVNAPQNGTIDVSARSNMKLRIWGPGQMYQNNIPTSAYMSLNPILNLTLTGPKVSGCTTGSGGSEITKNLTANSTIGGAAEYTVPLAGWTLVSACGADVSAADVLKHVARVVVNVPGTSFNFTNPNGTTGVDATAYLTGVNIGAISFK